MSVSPVFPHVMAIAIGIFVQTDGDLVGYTDLVSVPLPASQIAVSHSRTEGHLSEVSPESYLLSFPPPLYSNLAMGWIFYRVGNSI